MKKIKLVTVDLDGTLADTAPAVLSAINLARADFGYGPTDLSRLMKDFSRGARELVKCAFPDGFPDAEVDRALVTYYNHYLETCKETRELYPGMRGALGHLYTEGIRLAALTNKKLVPATTIMETLFPVSPFFRLIADGSGYPKKPDPTSMLALMEEAGATPEETVHIGDSEIDMKTAKAAGVASEFAFALIERLKSREDSQKVQNAVYFEKE